jgi:hypothetical protein
MTSLRHSNRNKISPISIYLSVSHQCNTPTPQSTSRRQRNGNQPGNAQQHGTGNQQGNNNHNNANVAENPKKNPKWILPPGKMFGELFYKNADLMQSAPKHKDKSFCLQYFTKGHFLRGSHCNLSHTDPRDCCGLEATINVLCMRAYA